MKNANILLLYTDKYYLIKQVYPFGLELIASTLRRYGHHVTVEYPYLPEPDLETNVLNILAQNRPEVIGLGIRNLDTCLSCEAYGDCGGNEYRTFYFLPEIKKIVDLIKTHVPECPIILGGGGFTMAPQAILTYLGITYGVVGEGEEPFRQFVDAFPDREKMARIAGLARMDGNYKVNPRETYQFTGRMVPNEREVKFRFALETTGIPVQVKRGCNQKCSYCVEPLIERGRIIYREIDQVIGEMKAISRVDDSIRNVFFVDTEFNLPDLSYCSRLIKRIIEEGLHERFGFTSQFLPKPFDSGFAECLAEAGFSIILTCDSFADDVLKTNQVSYREKDIQNTLEICEEQGLPCTVSMIFGLPGETYETVDYSIERMKQFNPGFLRRYEYTVGGRIYQGTHLCRLIETGGVEKYLYGTRSKGYIEPYYFCAPESPLKLKQHIEKGLGYSIAYENRYDAISTRSLAVAYLADQERWEEAVSRFRNSGLAVRSKIYDYFFRRLTGAGRMKDARLVSENLLSAIQEGKEGDDYREQAPLIQFYLNCLGPS
ncbi:MAG: radical SAM protein [Deltaproteobacteria bacterium]|nr:radical SAM protein [Deltaproteobacteria bacterium]